jgi:hypothetical protein
MSQHFTRIVFAAIAMTLLTTRPALAEPFVLTFDFDEAGLPGDEELTDEDFISQLYGDAPGLDLTYTSRAEGAVDGVPGDDMGGLRYFSTGLGTLTDVAFCCSVETSGTGVGEIRIDPEPGKGVRLVAFDLAAYYYLCTQAEVDDETCTGDDPGNPQGPQALVSEFKIFTTAYELLYSSGTLSIGASTFDHFFVDIVNLSGGLIFQWGADAYDVGLDNFEFQVVPEPSSLALLGLGLAAAGLHRWRTRKT